MPCLRAPKFLVLILRLPMPAFAAAPRTFHDVNDHPETVMPDDPEGPLTFSSLSFLQKGAARGEKQPHARGGGDPYLFFVYSIMFAWSAICS